MNRIYQGRASGISIVSSGVKVPLTIGSADTCPLWHHHQVFQDAINYYVVALGALAGSGTRNRVVSDLRGRLETSWEKFPRDAHGADSLRDSLRRSLPALNADATLQHAFDLILAGNDASPMARTLSLAVLLAKCGGDAAIQQGGRAYLPRFCDAKSNPTWDFSRSALESGTGAARLASVLHAESSAEELNAIADEMDLSWTVKTQPGKTYHGAEAKARLTEALNHLLKLLRAPSARLAETLASLSQPPDSFLQACLESVGGLGDDFSIPRNRKAAPDLTFATIAFKQFPHQVTQAFLKLGLKAPKAAAKAATKTTEDQLLASLGDDPVKLARGSRGFVFSAFTALPKWNPVSPGLPVWKEFDIAAFKEALKSLNQFNQKTIEREGKLAAASQTLAYMLGTGETLPKVTEGEGETKAPARPGKDPRWEKVGELEKELRLNLNEGDWELSRASLRGLRDLAEEWNKNPDATTEQLQAVVKKYQAEDKNKRGIGSVQLFLTLCEDRYRALWRATASRNEDEDTQHSADILFDAVQVHQLDREVKRFSDPIRLTPAEPRFSRRLFMFSDLTDKLAKVKFGDAASESGDDKTRYFETAIAFREAGEYRATRVRINYTAPRLHRDELLGGEGSRWLQPMTAALGLSVPAASGTFDSAVALMPDRRDDEQVRHLLNFPVSLDPAWLHESLGKAMRWRGQFNGTKDNNLHLHWPGTERDVTKKNRWWENPAIIEKGFTVLSNDLGQRSAGAWALLRVTCWKPDTKRPVRAIGNDGNREWFAEVLRTGMHRLPGEDVKVQANGDWAVERFGKRGRTATEPEYLGAVRLAGHLGVETGSIENWLDHPGGKSFPELNDQLVKIANRRLSRLGTYHRWSCFSPDKIDSDTKRDAAIKNLENELEAYKDSRVCELQALLEARNIETFRAVAGGLFEDLRDELEVILVTLADRISPLRGRAWQWQRRKADGGYGDLVPRVDADRKPGIRGQRGLSMPRLEQLEGLRRLFLRYNRSLDRKACIPALFGREDRGRDSGEPCRMLLEKIDRMKEQRVNQTAHLILAQALGVKLAAHTSSDPERRVRDLHGEYLKIEGREPVDFIVIEDLSRYLSSQGRAPSENSRLMKWSHRAIRDKLKMLAEEPFGVPVVEVTPAYSSRFHAGNGQPGSRLHELHGLDGFQRRALETLADRKEPKEKHRAKAAAELLTQFEEIRPENERRMEMNRSREPGTPPLPLFTLYFPRAGGPLFLATRDGNPVQADLNAATNLGLRAIAVPECMDIHRRVRAKKEKDSYRPRLDNAREKAAFSAHGVITLCGELSKKFGGSTSPNFFHEPDALLQADGSTMFDRAEYKGQPLVSGVALWSLVNNTIYMRCAELNRKRLARWAEEDPTDDIPK
jgi:IS605 OrfB family transposase